MSTQEWFWELDMKIAEHRQMKELTGGGGGTSGSVNWADARRRHSEKMKGAK